jgi:hypothetical protein
MTYGRSRCNGRDRTEWLVATHMCAKNNRIVHRIGLRGSDNQSQINKLFWIPFILWPYTGESPVQWWLKKPYSFNTFPSVHDLPDPFWTNAILKYFGLKVKIFWMSAIKSRLILWFSKLMRMKSVGLKDINLIWKKFRVMSSDWSNFNVKYCQKSQLLFCESFELHPNKSRSDKEWEKGNDAVINLTLEKGRRRDKSKQIWSLRILIQSISYQKLP